MKTDPERRAELLAKLAKIDQREANRNARKASKDVRKLERLYRAMDEIAKLMTLVDGATVEFNDVADALFVKLQAARAAAVPS